jgi:hypothetical protein
MKNPIIAELRRIRDAHAKKYNYDVDAILRYWMDAPTPKGRRVANLPVRRVSMRARKPAVARKHGKAGTR